MATQQRLIQLQIERLKNLNDVTIEFDKEKHLTAILGPNGFGKSTILHALAASFQPTKLKQGNTVSDVGDDSRYIDFFPNTPHGTWANTKFNLIYYFRDGAKEFTNTLSISKSIRQWVPIAKNRPEREIYFIGVSSSTPAIELERPRSKVNYITQELNDNDSIEIKQKAGYILNRNYTKYHTNRITNRSSLIGVEFQSVNYSALSMGAGEQRLFKILRTVKIAGKYALILIDELDLLFHTDALHRLLEVLMYYAQIKNLQIIFTTHRESVVNFESSIAIRHLYCNPISPYKTFCFKETKPEALSRLTGQAKRPLSIYCEDDVSTAIIEKVAQQAGIRKFVEISRFGAADNCFTLAAALLLSNQNLDNSLLVLDGDVYKNEQARDARMKISLTGNSPHDQNRRDMALEKIICFITNELHTPEQELHNMVINVSEENDLAENEVILTAQQVINVNDVHDYVNTIINKLGEERVIGLKRIVDIAAKSIGWEKYVSSLRKWFDKKKPTLIETK